MTILSKIVEGLAGKPAVLETRKPSNIVDRIIEECVTGGTLTEAELVEVKTMFLTAKDRKKLPPLYSQEKEKDPTVWVKFFNPYGSGTWLATEYDGQNTFFGAVRIVGPSWELGYFTLAELKSQKAIIGGRKMNFQGIERDRYFKPKPLSQAKKD